MNQKGFANIILVVVIIILVGAVGYFVFVKKSEPIVQPSTSQTTNLKTYTNTQYGFEVKYLNSFTSSAPVSAPIFFYGENPEHLKLEGYFMDSFNQGNLITGIHGGTFEKSEILVNGVKSYKVNSSICYMGCGSSYSVFIPYKNGAIVIGISRGNGSEQDPNLVKITDKEKSNFDQIISTFKFTK